MKQLPKAPTIINPFGVTGNSLPKNDFKDTGDETEISYEHGIPQSYSVPAAGNKVKFTTQEMNRICFDAMSGSYKHQFGVGDTFSPMFAQEHGGYPKGAILKWYQFSVYPGYEIPEDVTVNFNGEWEELDEGKTYEIGDIFYLNKLNKLLFVVTKAETGAKINKDVYGYSSPMLISSILELLSTTDNNQNDFRASGPTEYNGWKTVDPSPSDVYPDYRKLQDDKTIIIEGHSTGSKSFNAVEVPSDGWLVVSVTREFQSDSFSSFQQWMAACSDGYSLDIVDGELNTTVFKDERNFGASDSIAMTIPVSKGNIVSALMRNDSGVDMHIVIRLIGPVA